MRVSVIMFRKKVMTPWSWRKRFSDCAVSQLKNFQKTKDRLFNLQIVSKPKTNWYVFFNKESGLPSVFSEFVLGLETICNSKTLFSLLEVLYLYGIQKNLHYVDTVFLIFKIFFFLWLKWKEYEYRCAPDNWHTF